jgi:hypothetical protein
MEISVGRNQPPTHIAPLAVFSPWVHTVFRHPFECRRNLARIAHPLDSEGAADLSDFSLHNHRSPDAFAGLSPPSRARIDARD